MSAPSTGGTPYIQFGVALLFINPNAGNLATLPTAVKPYTIQNLEIDYSGDLKDLRGQNQLPDDVARSDVKTSFKFSIGRTDYYFLNQAVYGDVTATGGTTVQPNEKHTLGATGSGTLTLTVTPPNGGTFVEDLGVQYQALGDFQNQGATGPTAAGQYEVGTTGSNGLYTFYYADSSAAVQVSYAYTTTLGNTYQVNSQVQGWSPQFELWAVEDYTTGNVGGTAIGASGAVEASSVRLYAAKIGKTTYPYKRTDYKMVDIEGTYFANKSGQAIAFYAANG